MHDHNRMATEIVTLLSKKRILNSWRTNRDAIMGEQFYRTMSHSAFVIPLWIHLLSQPRNGFWHYCCLLWLIVNNTFSAFAACQIFFSALPPTPQEDGIKPKMAWVRTAHILHLNVIHERVLLVMKLKIENLSSGALASIFRTSRGGLLVVASYSNLSPRSFDCLDVFRLPFSSFCFESTEKQVRCGLCFLRC